MKIWGSPHKPMPLSQLWHSTQAATFCHSTVTILLSLLINKVTGQEKTSSCTGIKYCQFPVKPRAQVLLGILRMSQASHRFCRLLSSSNKHQLALFNFSHHCSPTSHSSANSCLLYNPSASDPGQKSQELDTTWGKEQKGSKQEV